MTIEVRQSLKLSPMIGESRSVREILLAAMMDNWVYDTRREDEMLELAELGEKDSSLEGSKDAIQFRYIGNDLPKAVITLFSTKEGYYELTCISFEEKSGLIDTRETNAYILDFALDVEQSVRKLESGSIDDG